MVDAGGELDDGRLERVLGGEAEDEAEAARVVDAARGRGERDVPGVQGLVGAEGDAVALGRALDELGVFLES